MKKCTQEDVYRLYVKKKKKEEKKRIIQRGFGLRWPHRRLLNLPSLTDPSNPEQYMGQFHLKEIQKQAH